MAFSSTLQCLRVEQPSCLPASESLSLWATRPPSLTWDGQAADMVVILPVVMNIAHAAEGSRHSQVTPFISSRLGSQGGTTPLQIFSEPYLLQPKLSDHWTKTHFPQNFQLAAKQGIRKYQDNISGQDCQRLIPKAKGVGLVAFMFLWMNSCILQNCWAHQKLCSSQSVLDLAPLLWDCLKEVFTHLEVSCRFSIYFNQQQVITQCTSKMTEHVLQWCLPWADQMWVQADSTGVPKGKASLETTTFSSLSLSSPELAQPTLPPSGLLPTCWADGCPWV